MKTATVQALQRLAAAALRASLLLGALGITGLAYADAQAEDEKRFGEEILEILRDEGKISEQRYEELKEKEATEAAAAAEAADSGWTIRYSNGLKFEKDDGSLKFNIGGRIQSDFATIHVDDDIDRRTPTEDLSDGDGEGVEFRRARFYMSGEYDKRFIWKSQIDFAGGDVTLKDMYLGMKGLGPLGTMKIGHFKEPYSLEELTSSKYLTFMERGLPAVFDSSRNFGLGFENHVLDKRMTWAAGIFAETDDGGEFFAEDTDFNLSGRVTGLPLYRDKGRQLIHVGLSGSYRFRDDIESRFRQRPEAHLAQRYLDTGNYDSNGDGILAAELAGVFGPIHLSGEYKHSFVNQSGGKDADFFGYYVQAGWFLTGEHRPYKTSRGSWARLEPRNPFDPGQGQWGAFEVAVRQSYLTLDSGGLRGGKERNTTVGLNWYLLSNIRFTMNYVYADVRRSAVTLGRDSGDIHLFQARAQLEF